MRIVAFDVGGRRTGVAVSDASGTLARPLTVLTGREVLAAAVRLVEQYAAEGEGVEAVLVGLPRRADGSDTHGTKGARAFGEILARRIAAPVHFVDERLTSVDAEARLAEHERDWRARKEKLDAEAAAVLLQDHLDARARAAAQAGEGAR
jgi:putative Holliday junction resolvase